MFEKTTLSVLGLLAIASIGVLMYHTHNQEEYVIITGGSPGEDYYSLEDGSHDKTATTFDLVDPECAPEDMLNKIMYGYHIMLETKKNATDFCGNLLDCANCHFAAGNTLGGKNRGISLVGSPATYPRFSKRDNKEITLEERIQNCFQRSMNGKAPPKNSLQMESIIAYLHWISTEVEDANKLPWLGLDKITSDHTPDAKNGENVYLDIFFIPTQALRPGL